MNSNLIIPENTPIATFEQVLSSKISKEDARDWARKNAHLYRELMTYYNCAMMEIETKCRVLNEDLSLQGEGNPIETIKTRLKSPESIVEKILRYNFPLAVESIEENIHDIAGVRVICSFESDIYRLAEALLKQDDIELIEEKDYIKNPKENGYRSLHLIVAVPIFLHHEKRIMEVEVQLRTLSMDLWASLEHKLRYKKETQLYEPHLSKELKRCADMTAELDSRMQELHALIDMDKDAEIWESEESRNNKPITGDNTK